MQALSCSPIWMVPDVLFLSTLGCHGVGVRYTGEAVRLGKGSPVGRWHLCPLGATTSRLRVTLLSLLRQTDELIVAIATKRPAPKDKGNWTVFTQLLIQVPFSTWFYRRVCVCAHAHVTIARHRTQVHPPVHTATTRLGHQHLKAYVLPHEMPSKPT